MKPLRKNVAVAIDGGGIRGMIVTQALAALEAELGKPVHDIFRLAAGTSTGSIISAGIGAGFTAKEMTRLYGDLGKTIFPKTLRRSLFPLTRYRYDGKPLHDALGGYFGHLRMGDFWTSAAQTDVVITTFDLVTNHTRFVKPWKEEYMDWPVLRAVQGSCTVPTYFPVVEGRYIDGGVGSYSNPCYLAAYEAALVLHWDPAETTLLSFGTGRTPYSFKPGQADSMWVWQWLNPMVGAFLQSADDQQVHLVDTFFNGLDFRRYQIDLREDISMDDADQMDRLVAYGSRLGRMMLEDRTDPSQGVVPHSPREVS
jgi:uncharacterized protein